MSFDAFFETELNRITELGRRRSVEAPRVRAGHRHPGCELRAGRPRLQGFHLRVCAAALGRGAVGSASRAGHRICR